MKHALIKFNYGVEIGAHKAYLGHYDRTKDANVFDIAQDEVEHRAILGDILEELGEKPSKFFNVPFGIIGEVIKRLCAYSPRFMLNFVARSMEFFAVVNYIELAKRYPKYRIQFVKMATREHEHGEYFKELQ